jgi:N12 class adenine-specific DNA methylase
MTPYNFSNLFQSGGVKCKLRHNINAVKLLRQLEQEERLPTELERGVLAQFTGWGTVASAINREVLDLLPNTDLNSDNAFQTPREIIEAVWEVLSRLGFQSGRIADPAANIGLWAGFQKPEYRSNSEWLLVEIDPTAKAIAQYLHPDAVVYGSNAQQQIGFENTDIPKDSFDLVVSNFPFGVTPPFDPTYKKVVKTLHNYFWAKSLALTTPGGLIASITSVGTMDSTPEFCQYLANQGARLIDVVRLPDTAFKCMNTAVTADLIILQKMNEPQNALSWGEVVDSPIKDGYGVPLKINRYFAENPEKVLGELSKCVLYGGERIAVAGDGRDLKQSIIDAFSHIEPCYTPAKHVRSLSQNLLPAEFVGLDPYRYVSREGKIYQYRPGEGLCLVTQYAERIAAGLQLKQALDNLVQAEIKEASNCEIWRSELNRLYQQFVKRYGELLNRRKRPSTLSVFSDDSELTTLCYALEEEIPAEVDLKEGKVKAFRYKKADIFTTRISGNLRKSDRTISSPIDAVYDCLDRKGYLDLKFVALLLNKTEEDTIATLKAIETPNGKQSFIFYDAQLQRWVTRDEYLSGDTRAKLQLCRTFKDINPGGYNQFWLYDNETELTKKDSSGQYLYISPYLLPPASESIRAEIAHRLKADSDIDSHLESLIYIDGGLGVPWVESEQVAQFTAKILNCAHSEVRVCHVPELGLWTLTGKASCREAANQSEYASNGSNGKGSRDVLWLIEQALNQSPIKIQVFEQETLDRKASTEATDSAIAQVERLKKEFKEWLWSDLERAYSLTVKYNNLYPLPQKRVFDGSYLSLPDSNTKIKLKPHQLNGIARAIQSKRLLTLWEVGTGKSYQIFASAYESQRLGIAHKPVIVALNSTLSQMVASFRSLYPNAKLLVADEGSWKERNKLIAKIQTGRYDAILLTHTQFFSIPISAQTKIHYIQEQLQLVEQYLDEAKDDKVARTLVLELLRQKDSLKQQINELETLEKVRTTPADSREFQELVQDLLAEETLSVSASGCLEYVKPSKRLKEVANSQLTQKQRDKKRDSLNNSVERATRYYTRNSVAINWEDLGLGWVWFDEIHAAKNIPFASKAQGIAGITNVDTQRSLNTLLKYRFMFEHGYFIGGGTGTLPSNSLTEVFNIMRLFCPDELQRTQTEHFDSWLGQYGEITTSLEFTSTGGIKSKTRVASFKNLWELMSSLSLFTDFVTADSANVERPVLHRHTITAPMNGTQLAITRNIKHWMERWQQKLPVCYRKADGKLVEHNPLTLTSLGSFSSVDPRLVDPDAPVHKETKLHQLIHNVLWIYRATDDHKGTQIIFSDSGVPKAKQHGQFDVYNYIRDTLVALGIPANQIAFIHEFETEAKRFKLYDDVNAGRIRILLGSTLKAGTGLNVQRLCIALHHLDLSWTPANLIQRRGRGHRQGNLWSEIWEFTYGTSGLDNSPGFDAYKANLVRLKAEMAYRIMSGNVLKRQCEDVGEDASHFMMAAAILSGNSAALDHAKITSQIRQREADLVNQQTALGKSLYALKTLDQDREDLESELTAASRDLEKVIAAGDLKGEAFRCQVLNIEYDSVEQAGKELIQTIYRIIQSKQPCFDNEIGEIAGLSICVTYIGGNSLQYVRLRGSKFQANSVRQNMFYYLGNWTTGRGLVSCLRDALKDILGENNLRETIAQSLAKKLEHFNLDASRLPERVERLTQLVATLKAELEPLKAEEFRLRKELVKAEESEEAETPEVNDCAELDLVPTPGAALYFGADADIVEYIRSLGEPTTVDDEGNLITWIDKMQSLELKPEAANLPSIEEARQKLEKTLELKVAVENTLKATVVDTSSFELELRAMRRTISAIGLPEEALNRVMENLTTRLKEDLGLLNQDSDGYLWETVGSVQQGRLF